MKDYRFEFKYLLDIDTACRIENYIKKAGMITDPAVRDFGKQGYTVTSLYFDSPFFEDYYDKVAGLLRRKKIRARMYGDSFDESDTVWLEVKYKHDMSILKKRLKFRLADWREFLNQFSRSGGFGALAQKIPSEEKSVLEEIKYQIISSSMRPHLLVKYKRKPYVGQFLSPLRVTFDSDLEAAKGRELNHDKDLVPVEKDKVVMEIKYNSALPSWFNDLVKGYGIARQSFSKYNRSVDAVYAHGNFLV